VGWLRVWLEVPGEGAELSGPEAGLRPSPR
jgi:hypothetical protein